MHATVPVVPGLKNKLAPTSLSNYTSRDSRSSLGRGKQEEGAVSNIPLGCLSGIWLSSIIIES